MRVIALAALVPVLALGAAVPAAAKPTTNDLITVSPTVETPSLFDDDAGGGADADDPAIWVNAADPARSLVLATAKDAGLRVYDLKGRERQAIAPPAAPGEDDAPGRFNNVAILSGFRLGHKTVDLAVVTDRGRDTLRFYAIDARTGTVTDVTSTTVPFGFNATQAEINDQATVYGLAVVWGTDGKAYAVATRRHTATIGLFELRADGDRVTYRRTDTYDFPTSFRLPNGATWAPCEEPGEGPQLEGLVVDPTSRVLYAAQEDVALWRLRIVGGRFVGTAQTVETTKEYGVPAAFDPESEECVLDEARDPGFGGRIAADVEGLTIYRTGPLTGTLLVSSQGDSTFYTYDRLTNRPLAHFAVVPASGLDGSQDCDGADVVSTPLPGYPNGLLVVHDGDNTPDVVGADGEVRTNTNFKYLDAGVLRRR